MPDEVADKPAAPKPKKAREPQDEFADAVGQLADSLRNVGDRFLQMLAGVSQEKGRDLMDSLLAPLEEGKKPKKRKKL